MPKIELIQGDCLEKMKDIPDGSIDMVFTSPPYNMNLRIRNGKHCSRQIVKELSTKYEGFDDNLPEGFWSLLKRAWLGQHHHYTKKYMPLYVAEAAFKYNNRTNHTNEVFTNIMRGMLYV